MQIRKLAIYLACVMACAGLACQKKVEISTFVVPFTYSGDLTVSSGGVFRWVSESSLGPAFSIYFVSVSPCQEGNVISGDQNNAAVCHVLPNKDGFYRYKIGPQGTTKEGLKDVPALNSHVDGCNGCSGPGGGGGNNGNGNNNSAQDNRLVPAVKIVPNTAAQLIVLDCGASNVAVADPSTVTNVSPGEILEWSQDGLASNTWQVSFQDEVCSNGKVFGTTPEKTPYACIVQAGLTSGKTYNYDIAMKNCSTTKGHGQLTVK